MRDSQIHINKKNLLNNINELKNIDRKKEIFPVIKANAYGHGILEIAKILREQNIRMICVAYIDEAIFLRNNIDKGDILLLIQPKFDELEWIIENNIEITISDLDFAQKANEFCKINNCTLKVHLFINTGMNRDGINWEDFELFINEFKKYSNLYFEGMMTHYSISEDNTNEFNKIQSIRFKNCLDYLKFIDFLPNKIHSSNSGAILNFNYEFENAFRPGISIYGINTSNNSNINLKPILKIISKIIRIYHLKKGDTTGYSFKFIAQEDTNIGVIPIGYGDGMNRNFSGILEVKIKEKFYPIVGTICMDLILIDLKNDAIEVNDIVEIINEDTDLTEIANKLNTIPYELLCNLNKRLPRLIEDC